MATAITRTALRLTSLLFQGVSNRKSAATSASSEGLSLVTYNISWRFSFSWNLTGLEGFSPEAPRQQLHLHRPSRPHRASWDQCATLASLSCWLQQHKSVSKQILGEFSNVSSPNVLRFEGGAASPSIYSPSNGVRTSREALRVGIFSALRLRLRILGKENHSKK